MRGLLARKGFGFADDISSKGFVRGKSPSDWENTQARA